MLVIVVQFTWSTVIGGIRCSWITDTYFALDSYELFIQEHFFLLGLGLVYAEVLFFDTSDMSAAKDKRTLTPGLLSTAGVRKMAQEIRSVVEVSIHIGQQ